MAWLKFWKSDEKSEKIEEFDAEREYKNSINRQNAELRRERARIDLENYKLEQDIKREQLQLELEQIRAKRAELFEEDIEEETAQSPDDIFNKMLSMVALNYMQKMQPQQQNSTFSQSPPQEIAVTIEKAREKFSTLPPMVQKQAKQMTDDDLRRWCISEIPNIDAQSVNNIITVVRNG